MRAEDLARVERHLAAFAAADAAAVADGVYVTLRRHRGGAPDMSFRVRTAAVVAAAADPATDTPAAEESPGPAVTYPTAEE